MPNLLALISPGFKLEHCYYIGGPSAHNRILSSALLRLKSPSVAMRLHRREFLTASLACLGALALYPQCLLALGGHAPALQEPAPDFQLPGFSSENPDRGVWQLADFRGQWLALYFYPRDFTGGCTIEARGFERQRQAFAANGCSIAGISADAVDDHESFCGSESLGFPLLSDTGGKVSRSYGSWMAPFSMRHTFLIDPDGILRASWVAVRPSGHAEEVLRELRQLQGVAAI